MSHLKVCFRLEIYRMLLKDIIKGRNLRLRRSVNHIVLANFHVMGRVRKFHQRHCFFFTPVSTGFCVSVISEIKAKANKLLFGIFKLARDLGRDGSCDVKIRILITNVASFP